MSALGIVVLIAAALGVILLFPRQAKAPTLPPSFQWREMYDPLIWQEATAAKIEPALLKAIVRKESNFDPTAINPEKSFTLEGKTYTAADVRGRVALREAILAGLDPKAIGLNPSIGLAQVRVSIARSFISGITAQQLFYPYLNLRAASRLLRQLFSAGITLDTVDAYNVGQDLVPRNLGYRDDVLRFRASFLADFPQEV